MQTIICLDKFNSLFFLPNQPTVHLKGGPNFDRDTICATIDNSEFHYLLAADQKLNLIK